MSILLFLIILSVLVIIHELGHFSVAKYFGIRVDEFGLGYPPKAKKLFTWRGTEFTLNWLPFGGFVKIFGENPAEETGVSSANPEIQEEAQRSVLKGTQGLTSVPGESFQNKNRGIQAAVLFAGVFFNFLFAWLLISLGLVSGLPAPAGLSIPIENPETVITVVVPGSPAGEAGLRSGDVLLSVDDQVLSPAETASYIRNSEGALNFEVRRGEKVEEISVTPTDDILPGSQAVGISMETIGTAQLPLHLALWHGMKITVALTGATAEALWGFLSQAVIGRADLSGVTGPVGLVGMVGEVADLGLGYLLSFTALISINLSIINLLPFPALDGGRLVFVGIEAVTRRTIPAKIFNTLNAVGFFLLVFLMILITVRDVRNIF